MKTLNRIVGGALALLLLSAIAPSLSAAQTGEALIQQLGATRPVPNQTFHADKALDYKVLWDVTEGPAKPEERVGGYSRPAGLLVQFTTDGVDRRRVHLAVIVHGTATFSIMSHAGYRAMHGVDNPNLATLEALHAAGVQIIVCGQALLNRKVPREQVLPFVKVAPSATFARAVLHAQGYAAFAP
jgi:intracellular sulfur oxidation DsrE/DsrF family protein